MQNREDGIDVYDDVGVKRLVIRSDAELLLDRIEYAVYGYHPFVRASIRSISLSNNSTGCLPSGDVSTMILS